MTISFRALLQPSLPQAGSLQNWPRPQQSVHLEFTYPLPPHLTDYLRAILYTWLSQAVTEHQTLARTALNSVIRTYNCLYGLTWYFFTLVSLAENSEELEIFIDFDRWDCRRIESSREYFTEPEVLTRTLLALWTLFTPIISKADWGRGLEK